MRILRLNNDLCELAEIEKVGEEIKDYAGDLALTKALIMIVNEDGRRLAYAVNEPATALYKAFYNPITGSIYGPAFLCSFDGKESLVSLTDEDYETAAKVLRSYGYVKGD